jgi:chaperonin cofactor prefoldin
LERQLGALGAALSEAEKGNESKAKEIEGLKSELGNAKATASRLERSLEETETRTATRIEELRNHSEKLESIVSTLGKEKESLQSKLSETERNLREFQESRSGPEGITAHDLNFSGSSRTFTLKAGLSKFEVCGGSGGNIPSNQGGKRGLLCQRVCSLEKENHPCLRWKRSGKQ